ncbi:hypothetical protein [Micromonospora sp. A202]|uniref:hypothetical protein n=1 Tax=Micromonospora sp. A202 TaxID=2572899 RepID=UPI001150FA9C|nr:hypothetical protein [Micromonospora sp. A202]
MPDFKLLAEIYARRTRRTIRRFRNSWLGAAQFPRWNPSDRLLVYSHPAFLRLLEVNRYKRHRRRVGRLNRRLNQRYVPGRFALAFLALILLAGATIVGLYTTLNMVATSGSSAVPNEATFRLEAIKVALTATGGLGALTALLVAYRKQRADEIGHIREQDRMFTDRFTAAAGQLGHERAAVRLAGAYALTRIADDSDRDRGTCLNTLAAYLRMTSASMPESEFVDDASERNVRTAMLDAILQRLDVAQPEIFWANSYLDLRETRLPYLRLTFSRLEAFASFDGTVFEGKVELLDVASGAPLQFKNCRFLDTVETAFQHQITSIDFSGSHFAAGLRSLIGWRCEQFIDLKGATIHDRLVVEHEDSDAGIVLLQGADLSSIGFDNHDLPLLDLRVNDVVYDERTRWPEGFFPPPRWRRLKSKDVLGFHRWLGE